MPIADFCNKISTSPTLPNVGFTSITGTGADSREPTSEALGASPQLRVLTASASATAPRSPASENGF